MQEIQQGRDFTDNQSSVAMQSNPSEFNYSVIDRQPVLDTLKSLEFNNSVSDNELIEDTLKNIDDDSEEDEEFKKYHQLLIQNYTEGGRSQFDRPHLEYQTDLDDNDDQTEKRSIKSVKSRNQTGSLKSYRSKETFKSTQTIKSLNSNQTFDEPLAQSKRKYLRQEARRIKNELKQEELKEKKEKRQFKDIDLAIEGKRKRNSSGLKSRRRKLTKRTLELLAKKFDELYASENVANFNGPRITIRDIGQLFDMGNSTIHKLYAQWMEDPSFYERITRESIKQKGPERKITLERLEHLARLIKENPFMTQNELTVELNKIDDLKYQKNGELIEITRTTVARLLKVGRFKKKRVKCVPKERNTTKSLEKRFDYCTKYKDIWMKGGKVYFLDESGFNLYMTRDKAWARPNEEITVNCPISKGKRFSLIAIIAEDGLTHWRIIEGTYRKYEFLDFVRQLFTRIRQQMDELTEEERNSEQNMRQKWLILDNCAIHDRQQTANLAKQCDMNIMYLPPYSPQLNPIENWFSEIKAKIRKINYTGEKQLLDIMHRTLKDYQNHDFSNYFRGILKHVEKGINKQRF